MVFVISQLIISLLMISNHQSHHCSTRQGPLGLPTTAASTKYYRASSSLYQQSIFKTLRDTWVLSVVFSCLYYFAVLSLLRSEFSLFSHQKVQKLKSYGFPSVRGFIQCRKSDQPFSHFISVHRLFKTSNQKAATASASSHRRRHDTGTLQKTVEKLRTRGTPS